MSWTLPGARRWPAWLVAVVILSLAVRLLAWWIAGTRVPVGDPFNYVEIARNIVSGRGIVIDDPKLLPNLRAFYPPGYPLLLAAIGLVLPLTATSLLVLNTLVDALAAMLLVKIGARLGQAQAGVLAGALYFLWPANALLAPLAYKEGLASLLVLAQLAALLGAARGDRRSTAAFGIAAGLTILVQPALAPFSALLAVAALPEFPSWRVWLKRMFVAALLAGLVLLPWWVRNAIEFGRFIPFTTAGGAGLWVGATPSGDGNWVPTPTRFLVGDEVAASAAMGAEAWRIIAADPLAYVAHCLAKIPRAFNQSHSPLLQLMWMTPHRHVALVESLRWIPALATVGLVAAAIVGAVTDRRSLATRLLLAGLAQILLFGMWFEFGERHRYFLVPVMLLVAAIGARRWIEQSRARYRAT